MSGVCRLGDKAKVENHVHGGPCCVHPTCVGPSISASANVFVDGIPALTLHDKGVHTACCGPNTWEVIQASAGVFINGKPAVRKGDQTLHCGITIGKMIEASGTVSDFSASGPFAMSPMLSLITGPNVVAIPDGATVIRDGNGNPIGYAVNAPIDSLGQVYNAYGQQVTSFPGTQPINTDAGLLNPVDIALLPLGGLEKDGAVALKDLLMGSLRKAAASIPRSGEELYATAYTKAVDAIRKGSALPRDNAPLIPGAPLPETYGEAGKQIAKQVGKAVLQHVIKHHGG